MDVVEARAEGQPDRGQAGPAGPVAADSRRLPGVLAQRGPQRLVPLAMVSERAAASPRLRRSAERRLGGEAELELLRHRVSQLELRLAALEERSGPR